VNTVEKAIEYTRTYKTPDEHQIKINELLAYLTLHKIRGKGSFPIPVGVERRDAAKDDAAIKGHTKSTEPVKYDGRMNDLGKDSPIRGRDKSLTDEDKKSAFGQAVDILAKLTKKDVGSVGTESYGGTYDAAAKVQKFTNRVIKELYARFGKVSFDPDGTKRTTFPDNQGKKMLEYVNGEVAKLRSSSVR
jgi:hypothetical protein